ncbi:hypothetical protein [Bdellovibrio sp. HCB209]|uniref:hypothetical protein n=1 Tax=Bdellovibrio sp. HCB209 TaxID=3394354 RepID=UPI0039B5F3B7
MKTIGLFAVIMSAAMTVQAKQVAPTSSKISPATIDQAIRLAEATSKEGVTKKITIVTTDNGKSTDVSPRYTVYLGYNSMAEMGNISAAYLIAEDAYSNVTAKRLAPGIYQVQYKAYRDEAGMVNVTKVIDANEAFINDNEIRKACADDFCDGTIKAAVDVQESTTSAN